MPKSSVQLVLDGATYFLPLSDVIDFGDERRRLEKEIAKINDETNKLKKKLANKNFTSRAPVEVVQENRDRLSEFKLSNDKLKEALARLDAFK